MKLYHLTDDSNVEAIKREGLRCDEEGNIFCCIDMIVANSIARDQLLLDRYGVFEISPEATKGRIRRDRVAEFTSSLHRIVKSRHIPSASLSFVGVFNVVRGRATEWDYKLYASTHGWPREAVDEKVAILAWMSSEEATTAHSQDEVLRIANERIASLYARFPPRGSNRG